MTCKKIKHLIYLYSYNELTEQERALVQTHLESCPQCRALLERIQKTGALLISAPHVPPTPDWERSWQQIQQRLDSRRSVAQGKISSRPTMWWAGALAASIAIFILGLFTGFLVKQEPPLLTTTTPVTAAANQRTHERDFFQQEFQDHLDNIKPVLLEYANYLKHTGVTVGKNMQVEKEMVIDLLVHNQLLLCRMPAENSRYVQQLLDELQDILTRIAAMTLDDPAAMATIKHMIRQKGLIFKMEALRPVNTREVAL